MACPPLQQTPHAALNIQKENRNHESDPQKGKPGEALRATRDFQKNMNLVLFVHQAKVSFFQVIQRDC